MGLPFKLPKGVFEKGRESFKESPAGDYPENITLNPGRHVAIMLGGRGVKTSKGPQVVFDFKVAGESEQAGGRVSVWFNLNEEQIVHLYKCLSGLGYDVSEMDEAMLDEILADIAKEKPVVQLNAKQNGEFVNVYIGKRLNDLTAGDVDVTPSGKEVAADTDAGGGKAGVKKGAHAKADDLVDLDRDALKVLVEEEEVELAIKKSTSDDEIREAIRAKRSAKKEEPKEAPKKEEPAGDDLDEKSRDELKAIVEEEEVEISIKKSTSEDDIRTAIRDHRAAKAEGGTQEPDPSAAGQSVELEVGMSVKATVKGKKVEAKVVAIDEAKGEVKVKTKDGGLHKLTADDLELE